jgi:hypothetical protein
MSEVGGNKKAWGGPYDTSSYAYGASGTEATGIPLNDFSYQPVGAKSRRVAASAGEVAEDERMEPGADSILVSNWPDPQSEASPVLGYDSFMQWFAPPFVLLFYVFIEISATAVYAFLLSMASWRFPGGFLLDVLARSSAVAVGRFFVVLTTSKLTGATLDLPLLLQFGFSEMVFGRRYKSNTNAGISSRLSTLGKVLVFAICQLVGFAIGVAHVSSVTGYPVKTGDCSVDYAVSCAIKPQVVVGVGHSEARWTEWTAVLLVMAAYNIAWVLNKRMSLWVALVAKRYKDGRQRPAEPKADVDPDVDSPPGSGGDAAVPRVGVEYDKRVPAEINDSWFNMAFGVAAAELAVNLLMSPTNGSGFNLWFWFVTSMYTNDYSGASDKVWCGFAAGFTIFVLHLVYWLLATGTSSFRSEALGKNEKLL